MVLYITSRRFAVSVLASIFPSRGLKVTDNRGLDENGSQACARSIGANLRVPKCGVTAVGQIMAGGVVVARNAHPYR